jgi:MSHA biogenesis protein MshJ
MNNRESVYHSLWNRERRLFLTINHWLFIERLFFLLICLIVGYVILYVILLSPIQSTKNRLEAKIQSSENKWAMLNKEAETIVKQAVMKLESDKKQYEALLKKVDELDEKIEHFGKRFAIASQVTQTLREAFDQHSELQLKNLQVLPVSVLVKPIEGEQELVSQELVFTFRGQYFDILSYLEQLEQLKMHVFWKSLKYEVMDYPQAEVTVNLAILIPPRKIGR